VRRYVTSSCFRSSRRKRESRGRRGGNGSFRFDVWERRGKDTGTIRMSQRYQSFREFYPFYLSEHANPACRRMHFVGTTLVVVFLGMAICARKAWWIACSLVEGYTFVWI